MRLGDVKTSERWPVRIFLYEFVTGGGWYERGAEAASESLVAEGSAMLESLAADLSAIPGVNVDVLRDVRCPGLALSGCTIHEVGSLREEQRVFVECARSADWSVVIAPEFCGYLAARCRKVETCGGRLLGPNSELVALASDKHATALHLASHGVRVPVGISLGPSAALPEDFHYPAVLKPRDGAGSQGVEFIERPAGKRTASGSLWRLEQFCPGTPASVAFLCGQQRTLPLVPCLQLLSDDGRFTYRGGSLPIEPQLSDRAVDLSLRAVEALAGSEDAGRADSNGLVGYVGVDLILGDDPSGKLDTVIEINPRLTTSYVGLRALFDGNLAAAMLGVAEGQAVELCWKTGSIDFETSGEVRFGRKAGGV